MLTIILSNLLLLLAIAAVIILIVKLTKTERKAPSKPGEDAAKHPIPAVPRSLVVAWICDGVITAVLIGAGIFLIMTDLADRGEFMDGLAATLGTGLVIATLVVNIPTAISIFMRRARVLTRMVLALTMPVLVAITALQSLASLI